MWSVNGNQDAPPKFHRRPQIGTCEATYGLIADRGRLQRDYPMVKKTKFYRKQADKAEQAAGLASEPEVAARYRALAIAYRSQADVLERKKLKRKKDRKPG